MKILSALHLKAIHFSTFGATKVILDLRSSLILCDTTSVILINYLNRNNLSSFKYSLVTELLPSFVERYWRTPPYSIFEVPQ